ncbi:hypothetical protein OIV83_005271 [Microbotryomycetes sp. JL201]|nr:hypothetical protein OIV83_005271 [Microbotryomycetes sp. JL201]
MLLTQAAQTVAQTPNKIRASLDDGSGMAVETWEVKAAAKRATCAALIPPQYRLLPSELASLPADVCSFIQSGCSVLDERQKEITDIDEASVLLEHIWKGKYSAVEVAEAFCRRAAVAQQLTNCLTETFFDAAIARARKLDEHWTRTGSHVGPLHGLPISLKDQFDIVGADSSLGFVSLVGKPASHNSVLVDILLDLGAVLYCKTNVPQTLMAAETNNNVFGRTVNPRNTGLTCGGSSGGEGALLALKGSILGVGTDYGGSIRVPSHCCGLYGLRPTTRRMPYSGVSNVMKGYEGMESTIGPMARSLNSLDVFMKAVCGAEPSMYDSKVVERPWQIPSTIVVPSRLHVAFAYDNGFIHAHPPLRRAINETVLALRRAGHEVSPLSNIDWSESKELVGLISGADAGQDRRSFLAPTGEPAIPEAFPFASLDCLSVYELSQLMQRRDTFRADFLRTWRQSGQASETRRPFDLIICPVTPHLAWPHLGRPQEPEMITWTTTWSILDLPAVTVPFGELDPLLDRKISMPEEPFSLQDEQHWDSYDPDTFANAPLVLQLVSPRRFREDELLALAQTVQSVLTRE